MVNRFGGHTPDEPRDHDRDRGAYSTSGFDGSVVPDRQPRKQWSLEELIKVYEVLLLRYAGRFGATPSVAADAVEAAFTAVWERRCLEQDSFSPRLLFRIVRNFVIDTWRKDSRRRAILENEVRYETVFETTCVDTDQELIDRITRAWERLSLQHREVLKLADIDKRSHPEIAKQLQITVAVVNHRVRAARAELKKYFDDDNDGPQGARGARPSFPV